MKCLNSFLLSCLFLLTAIHVKAGKADTNDSLTLAQAYINLNLTANYFDTLSSDRIEKILPFVENNLSLLTDSNFIGPNVYLYNLSYSLLYFNKAKLLFRSKAKTSRDVLLQWKNTLDTAIKYFNRANLNHYFPEKTNKYDEFIGFSFTQCENLKENILKLKASFNPYFTSSIYPDFQRIFFAAKKTAHFNFDSLAYYTALFEMPLSRGILDNTGNGVTINKTEGLKLSEITSAYDLDLALDLISRYLQLNHLAVGDTSSKSIIENMCTLYLQYTNFIKGLNLDDVTRFSTTGNSNQIGKDSFFLKELNPEVSGLLYNNLKERYLSALLTATKSYFNLLHTKNNFDSLSPKQIDKILSFEENELVQIKDTNQIKHYNIVYQQAFSLLYFAKAKLMLAKGDHPPRKVLLQLKNTLDSAIHHFRLSGVDSIFPLYPYTIQSPFLQLIGFTDTACKTLQIDIIHLKETLSGYFSRDIYPDFRRIFYAQKKSGRFSVDSLEHYRLMYNLPLGDGIVNSKEDERVTNDDDEAGDWTITYNYKSDLALDLISRYVQLRYMVKAKHPTSAECSSNWDNYYRFMIDLNPGDAFHFGNGDNQNQLSKDNFFRKEFDAAICADLFKQLLEKCGFKLPSDPVFNDTDGDGVTDHFDNEPNSPSGRYYFPIPAPFPSCNLYINDYKPALKTMKEVDDNMKKLFNKKGYGGQLHYYYVPAGFALTTSLERINENGSPVEGSKRWSDSIGGSVSFSLYETFRSIFFETESSFRMIALIISPSAATIQSTSASIGAMQDLLVHSYFSLPKELEEFSLKRKTLTVLVYNYYQSDIGKVPMLDQSKRLTVRDHLERSGLGELLINR